MTPKFKWDFSPELYIFGEKLADFFKSGYIDFFYDHVGYLFFLVEGMSQHWYTYIVSVPEYRDDNRESLSISRSRGMQVSILSTIFFHGEFFRKKFTILFGELLELHAQNTIVSQSY